ncbi:MAG: hypothetical protein AAF809_15275, partial [Bacteroidota bacterium]
MATNTRSNRSKRARKRDRAKAAEEGTTKDGRAKKEEGWRETLRFYVIAIAVILFIRTFFFTPFRIP